MGLKILFLDCDGVINDHTKYPNGYGGLKYELVKNLNIILDALPEVQIVVSSSWRYVTSDSKVFEYILLIHGANCWNRVFGSTVRDEVTQAARDMLGAVCRECHTGNYCETLYNTSSSGKLNCSSCASPMQRWNAPMPAWENRQAWIREGLIWRATQIKDWVVENDVEAYAVLDDLPLEVPNLVQTDGGVGITELDAQQVINLLK